MLRQKMTGKEIAARFDGRSRCAVISFVNRDPMLRAIGFQHAKVWSRRS